MKKISLALLMLVISLTTIACGKKSENQEADMKVFNLINESYLILEDRDNSLGQGELIVIESPENTDIVAGGVYGVSLESEIATSYPPQAIAKDLELLKDEVPSPISFATVENIQNHIPENTYIIDVRTADEFNTGHLPNATLIPLDSIQTEIKESTIKKDDIIIVYCRSGRRSAKAATALRELGYLVVLDAGGITSYEGELEH